ncbi:hypothetical protein V6N11_077269 [Hibiscus sabdariffa]|uniref:Uncharacterized protein n=1 Tax=Hibiscus sabdariffa TaxID=183260 RepID=A0ABR2TCK3_9ROSI
MGNEEGEGESVVCTYRSGDQEPFEDKNGILCIIYGIPILSCCSLFCNFKDQKSLGVSCTQPVHILLLLSSTALPLDLNASKSEMGWARLELSMLSNFILLWFSAHLTLGF